MRGVEGASPPSLWLVASLCARFGRLPSEILAEDADLILELSGMLNYADARRVVDSTKDPPKWALDAVFDIEIERYRRRVERAGIE